ncbi:hypothetical protein [Actinomycetospora atypica]|uniref:Uncharacterized protein n=1 Tax=Actinomycetospora atypica TaxID=1290095 RepID=A0ABV9YPV6_9PSEU
MLTGAQRTSRAAALGARLDRLCRHLAPLLSSDDALVVADLRVVAAAATRDLQTRPLALATRQDAARLTRCSALLDLLVATVAGADLAAPDAAVTWRRAAESGREPAGLDRRGRLRLRLLRGRARRAVLG